MILNSNLVSINLKLKNEISKKKKKKKKKNSRRLKLLKKGKPEWYFRIISYVPGSIRNIEEKINLLDGLSTIDEKDLITINILIVTMIMLMVMSQDVFSLMKMNILMKSMLLTLEVLIGEKMMMLQVFHVLKKEK